MRRSTQQFNYFPIEIESSDHLPPTPRKLPINFNAFECKHHEFQLSKHVGYSKNNQESSLKMRFYICHQTYELMLKGIKNPIKI